MQKEEFSSQNAYQNRNCQTNNMLVAVRVRPLSIRQLSLTEFQTVRILEQKVVVLLDPGNQFQPQDIFRKNRNKQQQYAFDFAFNQVPSPLQDTNTKRIYEQTTASLLQGILQGYNATVFAYGATGCGKTFTMVGGQNAGIMPLCISDLFRTIDKQKNTIESKVKVSYLQIYNQYIKDLLVAEDRNLDLREDPKTGVTIAGISEIQISNTNEMMALLKIGNRNRTKQATAANEVSSRSHAIFQVTIQSKQKNQGVNEIMNSSKLSLVDLAGSERAAGTTNKGQRMLQGAKINKSLLVLGNCIQALADASQRSIRKAFIPYRGSKLTRLLKDSLGGNCKTVMIANVSPAVSAFEDTYNTLNYANRAKNIKTNIQKNVVSVQNHMSNYVHVIEGLRKENQSLKFQLNQHKNQDRISLPPINPNEANKITLFENNIHEQFNNQTHLIRKVHQMDDQLQNLAVTQFKQNLEREKTGDKNGAIDQKVQKNRRTAKILRLNRQQAQKKYIQCEDKRQKILSEINKSDIGEAKKKELLLLYKSSLTNFQRMQIKLREHKIEISTKSKDYIIQYLKEQLKSKDKIINRIGKKQINNTNSTANILDTLQTDTISLNDRNDRKNKYLAHQRNSVFVKKSPSQKMMKYNTPRNYKTKRKNNASLNQESLSKDKKDLLNPDRYMKYKYKKSSRQLSPVNYNNYDYNKKFTKNTSKKKVSFKQYQQRRSKKFGI